MDRNLERDRWCTACAWFQNARYRMCACAPIRDMPLDPKTRGTVSVSRNGSGSIGRTFSYSVQLICPEEQTSYSLPQTWRRVYSRYKRLLN